MELLRRLTDGRDTTDRNGCRCRSEIADDRLLVDATDCPGDGRLSDAPACRASAVDALTARDVEAVLTRTAGTARAYEDGAAALLVAAGRFVDAVGFRDERLAERAARDPLGGAREATGRAGPVARIAAESGLAACADRVDGYGEGLRPYVGPTISRARIAAGAPSGARLVERCGLDTGATVRIYERSDDRVRTYHLEPIEYGFDESTATTLSAAYERLADGDATSERRAPGRAVRAVANEGDPVADLRSVLRKHTRGYGLIEDLFADDRVSDVFASAPVTANPLWVRVDGESMRTNVRLTADGADALASRLRRESGRAFSRAAPSLDASVDAGDRQVRVAGVTAPTSDGVGFAFRASGREAWTLPALIENGTLPASAAALLSVAVERGVAGLVAGPRGAGKTTTLGALLWEIPATTRSVLIEDTPELPVRALQERGRDVQALRSSLDDDGPAPGETLRTALRLGSGALVVGEIRGEEAGVLYEAMRVGANDSAVLGTIHGDGGADVRERIVSDLGVPLSSFGVTDLLVTMEAAETPEGTQRRVRSIEEVRASNGGDIRADSAASGDSSEGAGGPVSFATLYDRDGDGLTATGRIDRGNSRLLAALTDPEGNYARLRAEIESRADQLSDLARTGRTDPGILERARARWDDGAGDRSDFEDTRSADAEQSGPDGRRSDSATESTR